MISPMPLSKKTQLTKWFMSSHQVSESYRPRLLPVTSTRKPSMISENAPYGGGSSGRRRLTTNHHSAGTASIISG